MLLDHFHAPLVERRHWTAFHHSWAVQIATRLNEQLPRGWYAYPHVDFGFELDFVSYEKTGEVRVQPSDGQQLRIPPKSEYTLGSPLAEAAFSVHLIDENADAELVGAIELISRANKDRPETREAFVSKCETYLRSGVGLVLIDIVTDRHADLHNHLLQRVEPTITPHPETRLYAAAYRPVGHSAEASLEIWHEPLAVGGPLPVMPLYLKNGPVVPVDFSETYQQACQVVRIDLSRPSSSEEKK